MRTDEGYNEVFNQLNDLLESLRNEYSKEDFEDGVKDAIENHGFSIIKKVLKE